MILADSNVIIDIIENDPQWGNWSAQQVTELSANDVLAVNEIVVAEAGPGMGGLEDFCKEMESIGIAVTSIGPKGAFLAGAAFQIYRERRRDGTKSILADFLIGGHAPAAGATILTRDPRFYRAYFPSVPLITPVKDTQ